MAYLTYTMHVLDSNQYLLIVSRIPHYTNMHHWIQKRLRQLCVTELQKDTPRTYILGLHCSYS